MYHLENVIELINKSAAKGITKSVKERLLRRENYRQTLYYPAEKKLLMPRIGQHEHKVFTYYQRKSGLSAFNDKIWMRRIGNQEWETHSFGHYSI